MRIRSKLTVTVLAAALAVAGLGCAGGGTVTSSDNAPVSGAPAAADKAAGPVTVALGQPITVPDGSAQATVVATKVDKAAKANQFTPPKRGQFVAVTVEITATQGATDLGPSNFRFIASDGTVYQAEAFVAGIEPQLDAMTEIAQGQKKTGKVVFDCETAKIAGGKIQVSGDGFGGGDPVGYWTF